MLCKLKVEGQTLRWYGEPEVLAADSVDFVEFEFILPEDWDGYTLHATFQQADKAYTQVLEDRKCTLPSEIGVGNCGIGLFGYQPGKSPRATTNLLNVQVVPSGFIPDGEYPVPPTPDLYSQLLSQLDSKVDEAEQFAVNAVQAAQQAQSHANQVKSEADLVVKLADDVAKKATQASDDSTAAAQAKEAAETAKRLAETARDAAETAQKAAETAQSAAAQSATDADAAKQAAEAALKSTQNAAGEAANALSDLRELYQQMQTWAAGVVQDINAEGSNAIQSVQAAATDGVSSVNAAGNAQVQRVEYEATHAGDIQVERVKSEGSKYAQMAVDAAKVAQDKAAEISGKSDQIEANTVGLNELKQDLTGLQTVVDSKADKTDLAKTNLYLDALYKLNKGQTYDVLEQESKAYSVDVPSGAKYVGIDKVGGKSVVWNQLFPNALPKKEHGDGVTVVVTDSEYICTVTQPRSAGGIWFTSTEVKTPNNHKMYAVCQTYSEKATTLLYRASTSSAINNVSANKWTKCSGIFDSNAGVIEIDVDTRTFEVGAVFKHRNFNLIDLTQMFGAGNEPSTVEEFEAMFPDDYYPYSEPTIVSSQTDRVDVATADSTVTQQITTGFPVLNSAGRVYDYIDLNERKLHQRVGVVDLGTIIWEQGGGNNKTSWSPVSWRTNVKPVRYTTEKANILCNKYYTDTADHVEKQVNDKTIAVNKSSWVYIYDSAYISVTPQEFKTAMSGVMLYYELAKEIITDITIPTELTDWLTVEAGGSITFHNTDDGKRLLIPNKLSFVRKLDEVTV